MVSGSSYNVHPECDNGLAAEIELSDGSRFIGHTMSPQSFLADLTGDALDA
jgi:hypothetical protein